MVCAVSLHYPYKIHEVLKLTYRQVDIMFRTLAKKMQEEMKIKAAMFGCKIDEEKSEDDYKSYDTSRIDEMGSKFDELMQCQTQP